MENIIIIAIIVVIAGLAALYIYKAKKKGAKCIGCPYSCNCSSKDKSSCGACNSDHEEE